MALLSLSYQGLVETKHFHVPASLLKVDEAQLAFSHDAQLRFTKRIEFRQTDLSLYQLSYSAFIVTKAELTATRL